MTQQLHEPKATDFPPSAVFVRSTDGFLLRVTSGNGKEVLWRTGDPLPAPAKLVRSAEDYDRGLLVELPVDEATADASIAAIANTGDTPTTIAELPKLEIPKSIDTPSQDSHAASQDNNVVAAKPQHRGVKQRRTQVTTAMAEQMRQLRAEGKGPSEIARIVNVSTTTVEKHAPTLRRGEGAQTMQPRSTTDKHAIPNTIEELPKLETRELPRAVRSAIQVALGNAAHMVVMTDDKVIRSHYEGYQTGFHAALAIICGALGLDLDFMEEHHVNQPS